MALWPYAIASVAQTKAALGITDDRRDAVIEECINEASQMVEHAWGRHVVTRGSLTEYHTVQWHSAWSHPACPVGELHLNEWPIISVTTVHEDSSRVFATPLVVDTDYIVSKPAGKLIRVSSNQPSEWVTGWRAIKVVYLGGYQNAAGSQALATAVPDAVRRVFFELVRWILNQRTNNEVGLTQAQDSFGNRTFSGPAYITPSMVTTLYAAGGVPVSLALRTGERDA